MIRDLRRANKSKESFEYNYFFFTQNIFFQSTAKTTGVCHAILTIYVIVRVRNICLL